MSESVHAQLLPQSIEVDGRLIFARTPALQRTAPAAGLVISSIKPMAVVQRGATVMMIQGDLYAAAQESFLQALTSQGKSSQAFNKALQRLRQLKFAKSQINSLAQTRTIISPLPILLPMAGVVIDILPDGTAFENASTLFSLVTEPCIEVHLDRKTMEHLRPNKEAHLVEIGRTAHLTKKEPPDASGRCRCEFRLNGDLPAREATVRLTIHFAHWEQLGPDITYEQWPHLSMPRGQSLYDLRMRTRPQPQPAPAPKAKQINPFAKDADHRPPRVLAGFEAPDRKQPIGGHRSTIALPFQDWQRLKIAAAIVERREFPLRLEKQVQIHAAPAGELSICAPETGTFVAEPWIDGRMIPSNVVIGYIVPKNMPKIEKATTPISSPAAGRLTMLCVQQEVNVGDALAIVERATHILPASLTEREFEAIKHPLRLLVCRLQRSDDIIDAFPPIRLAPQARPTGSVHFDIPFPPGLPSVKEGFGFTVVMDEPGGVRKSLAIPKDCIMPMAKSHEVLIHHGIGKLTPASITVGLSGEFVEILHGLSEYIPVVRDLETLCRLNRRLYATMTGFWEGH